MNSQSFHTLTRENFQVTGDAHNIKLKNFDISLCVQFTLLWYNNQKYNLYRSNPKKRWVNCYIDLASLQDVFPPHQLILEKLYKELVTKETKIKITASKILIIKEWPNIVVSDVVNNIISWLVVTF
jgi:hypothetical protein